MLYKYKNNNQFNKQVYLIIYSSNNILSYNKTKYNNKHNKNNKHLDHIRILDNKALDKLIHLEDLCKINNKNNHNKNYKNQ